MGQNGSGRVAVTNSFQISVAKHNTCLFLTCAKTHHGSMVGKGLLYVVLKVLDPVPPRSSSFLARGQENDERTEFYRFL